MRLVGTHVRLAALGIETLGVAVAGTVIAAIVGGAAGLAAGLIAAAVLSAVALKVLEPMLDVRLGPVFAPSSEPEVKPSTFREHALACRSVEQLHQALEQATHAIGGDKPCLFVADAAQPHGLRILGGTLSEESLQSAPEAFPVLAELGTPGYCAQLTDADDHSAARQFAAELSATVVLPLVQHGALIGLVSLSGPLQSTPELDARLRVIAAATTVALANLLFSAEARGARVKAQEVEIATAVQEALTPGERAVRTGSFVVRGVTRAASHCGGDFWTWAELPDGRWLVLIGDVTGHGAAAAMLTAVAKGACDAIVSSRGASLQVDELLEHLNVAVRSVGRSRYYMTGFALTVDLQSGECAFSNAGHEFPYILSPPGDSAATGETSSTEDKGTGDNAGEDKATGDGAGSDQAGRDKASRDSAGPGGDRGGTSGIQLGRLVARGNPLGHEERGTYAITRRTLAPGESLLLLTDGVVDAVTATGERFLDRRLRRALLELAPRVASAELPQELLAQVDAFRKGAPLIDDLTAVTLSRSPV